MQSYPVLLFHTMITMKEAFHASVARHWPMKAEGKTETIYQFKERTEIHPWPHLDKKKFHVFVNSNVLIFSTNPVVFRKYTL